MVSVFQSRLLRSPILGGPAAVDALADHAVVQASARPLVLAGATVSRTPFFAKVVARLRSAGRAPQVVGDVTSPASCAPIEAMAARHAAESWDAIVAVGGGSTLDTAKALALLIARGGVVRDHAIARAGGARPLPAQRAAFLPIVAIPTTLSGSEANMNASIRDRGTGERFSLADAGLLPCLILLDPEALASQRRELLLGSAFNALAHCVEGIYSTRHHVLADAQAQAAGRMLCAVLARPDALDEAALLQLQLASVLAGALITEVYVGLHHAMCHALVSVCGLQHAQANGAMLPRTAGFNLDALAARSSGRVGAVAEALGVPVTADARATAAAIRARLDALQVAAGIPRDLTSLGVPRRSLQTLADYTLQDRALNTNPVPVERAELIALFEQSL